jgi:phosphopantothenoylcysteine decarboxylase / phosphopantothenate---cysteine ligase
VAARRTLCTGDDERGAMSRILLGVSGGIAAYKACELVRMLVREGHEVRVVATENGLRFAPAAALEALSGHRVRHELFDAAQEAEIGHIALADWAEVMAVVPATAQTLARLAHGMADDLLATVCLATRAPLVLAPAMNVNMYRHPATQENLAMLLKRGANVVGPESGELACGWEGEGRLAALDQVVGAIERALGPHDLRGEVVLVTAGPTAEPIDPVRVISNRSSGKMGFAIAGEAARRGAEVLLIAGPVSQPTPFGVQRVDVQTTEQMRTAVLDGLERATIVIKSAAVADYRPRNPAGSKLKRAGVDALAIELVMNPDISAEVAARKGTRTVVGFAAETERLLENATDKLVRKGYDLIVGNDVSRPEIGFDSDRNEVLVIGPQQDQVLRVPEASKREVARRILDRIREVRRG